MVAGNVPPSEVAKTLGHEIIGHKGLRAVFGENFDALLDLVYKDHAAEINDYAARYLRDPENNVDNQRYLTEEFLADCADAEVKPSWWKELIAKIRMWLRNYLPNLNFSSKDIEGVISMAARRIRREGARGNMGEYGNVWDGMGEDTVVDGATAKENLAVGADGNTGNTATGAAGLRFALDEDDLSVPVVLPEQQNSAGEILSWLEKAVNGDTDLDFYGNDLAEQFDSWAELDGVSRRELLEQSYEEEIREAKSNDGLENDFALKDAYQDAFDSIEEKISEVLEDNGLELDNSKVNASGNSFYLKFEAPDGEYYTLRFSDHKQPARGSYRQNEHFGGRSIADVDVVLTNGKFDIAPAVEFIQRVAGGDGTVENGGERRVTELKKLDHSQYQENTMLSGDEDIALIDIPQEYKTVDAAEKEIAEKIKQANGRLIAVNEDQKMDILIQSHDSLDEAASEKALNETLSDGTSAEIHAAALANIEQLLSKARLGASHRDWHTYAKNQQRGTNKETALQIHRFYTAMQYGDDIYGVKMTVREKQNGSTVFYTLEAHDLDIEKINPETESSRGGVAKAALPGRSPAIKFSSFFEKFKPVDDFLGLKYKNKYPNIRFLLAEFSEADRRDITLILKPFVGFALDHEDRIYKEYLAKKGIAVSEKDAHAFAVFAMRENNSDRNKRTAERREKARLENIRRRDQYLYDNFPFYREAVEFAGSHDFKIKPSGKFRGEEFSGSFIAPEFVKYSGEKAAKNSGKLDAAQGVNSDELAAKLARSWGRDALEVEQEIIDFFRELKKRDFYKEYSDFRKNAVLEDKEANRRAAEEFEAQEKFRIENEVIEVLEGKIPITEVWVKENRSVYDELYRQIMKEEPPRQPGKKDIETLNAAVNNETVDAAAFAAAYKAAREAAANEYMAKLRELRDKVMENKADAVQLQKDAWNIARLRLPLEEQAGFVSILN